MRIRRHIKALKKLVGRLSSAAESLDNAPKANADPIALRGEINEIFLIRLNIVFIDIPILREFLIAIRENASLCYFE